MPDSNSLLKHFGDALANKDLLHEPANYNIIWTIIGILFLISTITIIVMIFYTTRKKKVNTLNNLQSAPPKIIDIDGLRKKYLALIQSTEQRFVGRQIKASVAHQEFSLIVRLFYAEASGFHAEFLTLNDLKRSTKQYLTKTIESYYPNEFNQLEQGSVASSAEQARNLIMSDEDIDKTKLIPNLNNLPLMGGKT